MVFVRKSEEDHVQEGPGSISHWFAKILEVRDGDGDASRVYLRVFWVYRPEDLPCGRQPFHGGGELIVSNHMDIIQAVTVDACADVVYWNDDPESMAPRKDELFFRQSYDVTKKTDGLSVSTLVASIYLTLIVSQELNTYCIDKKPSNPDEPLIQCPHCLKWLHAGCLKERALQDSAKQMATPPGSKTPSRPSKSQAVHSSNAKIKGGASETCLTIMEERNGNTKHSWDVDISCLMCGKMIENAGDVASEQLAASTEVDENALENKYSASPHQASCVSITPIQDDENDSVMGNEKEEEDSVMGDEEEEDSVIGNAVDA